MSLPVAPLSLSLMESTFPGWPEYTPVSTMHMFLLTLGGPLLVGLLITGLALGASRRQDVHNNAVAAGMTDADPAPQVAPARPQRAVEGSLDADDDRPRGGATVAPRGI